ncbi:MAG: leucine-rich repeat protein [Clostridia bacterium]|nr:leucine-rich repeat protein [Clostridia bacterium]
MEKIVLPRGWENWTIEELIGRGSYGAVYRASCEGKKAAIKIIEVPAGGDDLPQEPLKNEEERATYCTRIAEEAFCEIAAMRTLKDSAHTVQVEDFAVVSDAKQMLCRIFIRMELLSPLSARMSFLLEDPTEQIKLAKHMAMALRDCAKKGILHRDVKPSNILVDEKGNYKLGDFGVAKSLEGLTCTLSGKGTFGYMAPEVASGSRYDHRADIYSLGLVLYRFANNNRMPFQDTEKQLLLPSERRVATEKRMKGDPLPPPVNASKDFSEIILKACAFDPADRFESAEQMLCALENAEKGILFSDADQIKQKKRGRKGAVVLSAVALLLALLLSLQCCFYIGKKDALPTDAPSFSQEGILSDESDFLESLGKSSASEGVIPSFAPSSKEQVVSKESEENPTIASDDGSSPSLDACDHSRVILLAAKQVSCIENGLTEGEQCALCGEILKEQQAVVAMGHSLDRDHVCTVCGFEQDYFDWAIADGVMTVDGRGAISGELPQVARNGIPVYPWADRTAEITEILVGDGITEIGDYAFSGLENVTEITFGESVGSLGQYALSHCPKLREIVFHKSIGFIGQDAFTQSIALEKITLKGQSKEQFLSFATENDAELLGNPDIDWMVKGLVHEHQPVAIPGVAATCQKTGLSEGSYCSVCGEMLVAQTVVPKAAHTEKILPAITPTCTQSGHSEKTICAVCELVLDEGQILTADHEYEQDGNCIFCGAHYTEAFVYSLNEENTGYVLQSIGNYSGTTVTVPEYHKGLPVLAVGDGKNAVFSAKTTEKVILGGQVLTIEEGAFENCTALRTVSLNDTLKSVRDRAFYGCASLRSMTFKEGLAHLGAQIFYGCDALEYVVLPKTLNIVSAFERQNNGMKGRLFCYQQEADADWFVSGSMPDVYFADDWQYHEGRPTPISSIHVCTFEPYVPHVAATCTRDGRTSGSYCAGCGTVAEYQRGIKCLGHDYVDGACSRCDGTLFEYELVEKDGERYYSLANTLYTDEMKGRDLVIPSYFNGLPVRELGNDCMCGVKLNSLTIPSTVMSIRVDAFSSSQITQLNITDLDAWCRMEIECSSTWPGSSLGGSDLYLNWEPVTEVIVPDDVTRLEGQFEGFESIVSVTLPKGLEYIGYATFSGTSITSIVIPEGVKEIGSHAFYECSELTDVTLPQSIERLNERAFQGCESLTDLTLPSNLKYIGKYALSGCGLTLIIIPDGVKEIDELAFWRCESLKALYIPASVERLGKELLRDCAALEGIYFEGALPPAQLGENWDATTAKWYFEYSAAEFEQAIGR